MEIQGTVVSILPLQTGQGKSGQWQKSEFIIETPGQFPKKVCLSLWGEENINKYDLETGMKITAHINIESREYQSRWYTEVRAWKIETSGERRAAPKDEEPKTFGKEDLPPPISSDSLPF